MRKNIDLSDEAVKVLSIEAIENGTNFKNYVEAKLEELSQWIKNRVKDDACGTQGSTSTGVRSDKQT